VFLINKLAKLPRSQKLRKAAKLFGEAEHRIIQIGNLAAGEAEYLGKVADLLSGEESFSDAEAAALIKASQVLRDSMSGESKNSGNAAEEIRRILNTVYFLLLEETGRNQADWDFIEESGSLDASKRRPFPGIQVYLEDIRSPFNVGSMFRTAESFGAEKIWLSPFCADPKHKRAERTAMGCVDVIPWERFPSDPFCRQETPDYSETTEFSFSETQIFALETGGIPLRDFSFPASGILIAGSEELGVSPAALAAADASAGRVSIPTFGAKGSLNVSVAFGIVMQAWARQNSINHGDRGLGNRD